MGIDCVGITDIGRKRQANEDSYVIKQLDGDKTVAVVCDGMGGAKGGKLASSLACEKFLEYIQDKLENISPKGCASVLSEAVEFANKSVCEKSKSDKEYEGMGTTLVAALWCGKYCYCTSVGDSRIYVLKKGRLNQLSHDHSYVQGLVDAGRITKEDAKNHPNKNIIMKAVGINELVCPDTFKLKITEFDGMLLCSDGLCGYVDDEEMEDIIGKNEDMQTCLERLVEKANEKGGPDNITAVLQKNN